MVGQIIKYAANFAVPVFIMIAGYYSYGKDEVVIRRRLIRMLGILALGLFVYFVCLIIIYLKHGNLLDWLSNLITLKSILKFFCFVTIDWAIPLWYLIAMSETYLIWYVVLLLKKTNIYKIYPILFLVKIFLTVYVETLDLAWFWKMNVVISVLPYFLLGYSLRKNSVRVDKIILIVCAVSGLVIAEMPIIFNTVVDFSCIGTVIYAIAIFIFAINYPNIGSGKTIQYIGDKLSLWVYIFHLPVSMLISKFLNGWVLPIITVIGSLMIAVLVDCVQKIIKRQKEVKSL